MSATRLIMCALSDGSPSKESDCHFTFASPMLVDMTRVMLSINTGNQSLAELVRNLCDQENIMINELDEYADMYPAFTTDVAKVGALYSAREKGLRAIQVLIKGTLSATEETAVSYMVVLHYRNQSYSIPQAELVMTQVFDLNVHAVDKFKLNASVFSKDADEVLARYLPAKPDYLYQDLDKMFDESLAEWGCSSQDNVLIAQAILKMCGIEDNFLVASYGPAAIRSKFQVNVTLSDVELKQFNVAAFDHTACYSSEQGVTISISAFIKKFNDFSEILDDIIGEKKVADASVDSDFEPMEQARKIN
jgi:hypothetical protein